MGGGGGGGREKESERENFEMVIRKREKKRISLGSDTINRH